MRTIIGIAGKARSGKDTVAKHLWTQYGFTRLAFADPVKMAAQIIFGLSNEATWGDEFKETVIPYWGKSPRQIFQLLGTECVKPFFGEEVWIKRLQISLESLPTDDIVIPDVRFEPEARWIRQMGGTVLHLQRTGVEAVNQHVSEAVVEFRLPDEIIVNDGTLEQLQFRVDALISKLM